MKLLSYIFLLKLVAHSNLFNYIKKKYELNTLEKLRRYESLRLKYVRVLCDIKFIKCCNRDNLVPKFARISNGVVNNNKKLNGKVTSIIIKTELQKKHREKRDLLKEIKTLRESVFDGLSSTLRFAVLYNFTKSTTALKRKLTEKHTKKITY